MSTSEIMGRMLLMTNSHHHHKSGSSMSKDIEIMEKLKTQQCQSIFPKKNVSSATTARLNFI